LETARNPGKNTPEFGKGLKVLCNVETLIWEGGREVTKKRELFGKPKDPWL